MNDFYNYALIVRHGIAAELHELPEDQRRDELRPLTKDGELLMQRYAACYQQQMPKVGAIIHSPLLRAKQTAQIIGRQYLTVPLREVRFIKASSDAWRALEELDSGFAEHCNNDGSCLILVSHETFVSRLAALWTTGNEFTFTDFDRGGAMLLRFSAFKPGFASMIWMTSESLMNDRRLYLQPPASQHKK